MRLEKCRKCGKPNFIETIDKGIKQENHYEDGCLVKEVTTYSEYEGNVKCTDCGEEYKDAYDL